MAAIAVSGASGFVGSALVERLRTDRHVVRTLVRRPARTPGEISWDPAGGRIDAGSFEGIDAVVHLAGETLAQRWTADRMRRIRESRVAGTSLLAGALAGLAAPPAVLISASAIGYYGERGDEILDETSPAGAADNFLASVCRDWEAATGPAAERGIRVVMLRNGIVLGRGGVLAKMLPAFRLGLGGRLGDGRQWLSWIALADLVGIIAWLVSRSDLSGPVNAVSPNPVTNAEFTRTLGLVLHRPAVLPVPAAALRLALGRQMADETVLASQRVRPRRLLDAGYEFSLPTLEASLRATRSTRSDDR
jgi:uncharacterized protein (TIGR01777 family)